MKKLFLFFSFVSSLILSSPAFASKNGRDFAKELARALESDASSDASSCTGPLARPALAPRRAAAMPAKFDLGPAAAAPGLLSDSARPVSQADLCPALKG